MTTLFPVEPKYPEGLTYSPNFLTPAEEEHLLHIISDIELHPFIFQGFTAKRNVASFGYDYSFDRRTLSEGAAIPQEFDFLLKKVAANLGIGAADFVELLVLEYPPGAVINWHRDAPPFGIIAGISLLSDCKFRLRPHDKKKQGRGSVISFPVERRSLYVMQGAARSEWEHSIAPVIARRYSVTLRTLRPAG